MIVTLAGHVDHGKTSLVRALSGVDTDRLAEEKRRGLTIDLGFAYIDDGNIGFVDVPGHQKFIHNMVAGVAAEQTALLVIAADDGPMPQSQEHLDILQLLGIRRGIIAITKCDRVDDARLAACKTEVANLVAGTFLQDAPVFVTSAEQLDSLQGLLTELRSRIQQPQQTLEQPFRLAIDRAFTIKGAGIVVTGTVHQGQAQLDDTLFHYPSGQTVRVRSLRAQDQTVTRAVRGDRCAINISGLDLSDVQRGHWLSERQPQAYRELTVNLHTLARFPREIKHWTPVHLYHATSHSLGHLALHSTQRIKPGQRQWVDVVLDEPLWVNHGDQVIVRDHGLDTTLGGGAVQFARTRPTRRRRSAQRLQQLQAYRHDNPADCCADLLKTGSFITAEFAPLWQLTEEQCQSLLKDQGALVLNGHAISQTRLGQLARAALAQVQQHQQTNPDSTGLKANEFKQLPAAFAQQVLAALVQAKALTVNNGVYNLPGQAVELPAELATLMDKLQPQLDSLQPPSSGDLAKLWQTDHKQLEVQLRELSRRQAIIYIADHRYYLPERLQEIAKTVQDMAAKAPFTVREFRDATGIGRNVAIDLLEYFDSKGFTRRDGNHRKVLRATL